MAFVVTCCCDMLRGIIDQQKMLLSEPMTHIMFFPLTGVRGEKHDTYNVCPPPDNITELVFIWYINMFPSSPYKME